MLNLPDKETVTISRALWIQLQQDAARVLVENANLRVQLETQKEAWFQERYHWEQKGLQLEQSPARVPPTARVHQHEATGGKQKKKTRTEARKTATPETTNDVLRWESKNQLCISYETHCAVVGECKRLLQVLRDKYRQETDKLVRQLEEAQQHATHSETVCRSTCIQMETQLQCFRKLYQKEAKRSQSLRKKVIMARETSFTLKRYLGELLHFAQEVSVERNASRAISQKCRRDVRRLMAKCDQGLNLVGQLQQKLKDVTAASLEGKTRHPKKVGQRGRLIRQQVQHGTLLRQQSTLAPLKRKDKYKLRV